ncbi:MAG: hypothetical protein LBS10_03150 [Gracilibacteraceae bacterium]|jgi:hypothetical protein|nr:hypothetical protein [Gracilibacteraceae bacterium]
MNGQKENFNYKHAKSSFMSALESFKLVHYLADIGEKEGNVDSVMRAGKFNQYFEEVLDLAPGQSDFRSAVPLVYTLLNGIELFIKGCEYTAYPERVPKAPPKLANLLTAFRGAVYPKPEPVVRLVEIYTTGEGIPALLARFLEKNGKAMNDLLTVRRFISYDGFFNVIEQYEPLLFGQAEGREFFAAVRAAVESALAPVETLMNDIDEDGFPGSLAKAMFVA